MKVKKYIITIECQDQLKKMQVSGIYLPDDVANNLYLEVFRLYSESHPDEEVEAEG